jgi:hypothetical protein
MLIAYGVVPNLSGVLASMLPMLGMAKLDSYKLVFATGIFIIFIIEIFFNLNNF